MMEDKAIELPPGLAVSVEKQTRLRRANFLRTYANSVAVGLSPWDVRLTFGDILGHEEVDGKRKAVIEETVEVLLTRETAKALTAILHDKITAYEREFGEIKLPTLKEE